MVRLTRIYTRTGDGGSTRLSDMSTARKTDARVEAYGDVDEVNSFLGAALATGELPPRVAELLRSLQNELFDLGADLSTPLRPDPPWEPLRITQDYVDRLEGWCDEFGEPLPALTSFILPGGSTGAAQLHLARTVTRRAERRAWTAVEAYGTEPVSEDTVPGGINLTALTYLNRLSDLLFILIRVVNGPDGDILWVPGGERDQAQARSARRRRVTPPAEDPGSTIDPT
jgi:cob(I)alamin adenosyltransferase